MDSSAERKRFPAQCEAGHPLSMTRNELIGALRNEEDAGSDRFRELQTSGRPTVVSSRYCPICREADQKGDV